MRVALIGHRGVGKTSLLERIQTYYAEKGRAAVCIDLDQEIEMASGLSIASLFSKSEEHFRKVEREVFTEIETRTASVAEDVYLACGGGFNPNDVPPSWKVLWVRRPTDASGRIFLDRPRLDAGIPPIDEFLSRAESRTTAFTKRADEVLWLDEGIDKSDDGERAYFLSDTKSIGGAITLLPSQLEARMFKQWLAKRLSLGVRWIELRDDLLSIAQMKRSLTELPDDKILLSFRDWSREPETMEHLEKTGVSFDWPIEWGECTHGEPAVFSLHEREPGASIESALARFDSIETGDAICKAALKVDSFEELEIGHAWFMAAPETRVFLPMSSDGRWVWYRLWLSQQMKLGFLRDGDGTSADQPSLLQWIRRQEVTGLNFAALLGDPVSHSRTPSEHAAYFKKKNAQVFPVLVPEQEFAPAMRFLRELGLSWASVTSPLKNLAFKYSAETKAEATRLESVNTLALRDGKWIGTNTDLPGLINSLANLPIGDGDVAVWGGGGTLAMVKEVFPLAEAFSVRTGENRVPGGVRADQFYPRTVVWAVGRPRMAAMPPVAWVPELIIDLNYSEDSPGREYAALLGCRYISGLAMFKSQAEYQRRFWDSISGDKAK